MNRMDAYRAYLSADEISKLLLMAHVLNGYADPLTVAHHVSMADEKFAKLASALGYRVEKIGAVNEAA
ncbi:MAG: hypothetical protein IT552_13995 [Sphingomonadaceae bacterium]|nr:hypothetical protein [Sphingomonadaceae bacterium]